MVASLQILVKDIEKTKEDFDGKIMRLEMNYKMINANLITMVNFSYKTIKSSAKSVRVMKEKFERAQEEKYFFMDIDVVEKAKKVT